VTVAIDDSGRFRFPRGEKPRFHADPAVDDLMTMIVALASEVSVLRERLDTHEQLAQAKGCFTVEQVDHFEPDAATQAARAARRNELVDVVFRPILAPAAAAVDETHASVVAELEGDAAMHGPAGA